MKKYQMWSQFYEKLQRYGFSQEEADALRRIELTLSRWSERECNGEIERDEETGKTYAVSPAYTQGRGEYHKWATADKETGALKRMQKIVDQRNARYGKGLNGAKDDFVLAYHQTDPRGCALHLVRKSDLPKDAFIVEKKSEKWTIRRQSSESPYNVSFGTKQEAEIFAQKETLNSYYTRGIAVCL